MASPLLVSVPGSSLRDALGDLPDGVELIEWDMASPPPTDTIDIVVPPYMGAIRALGALEGVTTRLVQSQSIGYDGVAEMLPPGHRFANAATVHETATAELTLALILASQRGIPDFVRAAERGEWAPARHPGLADQHVLIIGYGGVGKAIEDRLLPFETTVERVARTARHDERGPIHGISTLPELLPFADIVIVAVPLSHATEHLVDHRFLSLMPDGALLVNIARGRVADTDALLEHATSGRLRLALDVTDPEPLPTGHPLLALPNVLVSPHIGGATNAMMPRMARLLREQIERMLRDESPLNVVLEAR
ncbi:2-hydroxyacid dehydrogenase [Compostimonas suwonensis]|uniref:Phosphoglycerate dehydrogenase-like enzyme n=1 Tax=Compostimonas suwonensis TaxID=1048394 RepID=A0A2M9C3W1_9MICO|nr:2-hydroxyacid dehydrogenase [Compostimonas suwonensis]PJJ65157.1 phosphoglycerate dehydrogenase-like enzyme [Compostimonas suwonensis]